VALLIYIYLLTAIGLPPGASCTVHIYTQTIHRTTKNKQYIEQHKHFENNTKILEECGPCPDMASYTLAFAFFFFSFFFFFFFFRARQLMPRMHLSLRLIVQP
jgi:ribonucleotide reductase beta subunit family protein with ferritin-like domain